MENNSKGQQVVGWSGGYPRTAVNDPFRTVEKSHYFSLRMILPLFSKRVMDWAHSTFGPHRGHSSSQAPRIK